MLGKKGTKGKRTCLDALKDQQLHEATKANSSYFAVHDEAAGLLDSCLTCVLIAGTPKIHTVRAQ